LSLYVLIPIIEVAFCLALLVLLIVSGQRHAARRPFSLFLIGMGLWGFFIFMMRSSSNLADALFWEKFVFVAILSAALFFYRFTISLTGTRPTRQITYLLYIFYLVFICLIPTGLVVSGMQVMWYGKAPIIGPLFFPYVLCVYTPLVLGLMVLINHHKKSRILNQRTRDSYIIAGIIVMFIGGTTDYLPPLGVNMYPLGIIGNIMFCVMATIAMLRYELLEMKVVLRKGVAYSLISMFIFGIFGSLIFLLSNVFQELRSPISLTITTITVFVMAAAFQPILSKLQHTVDRWFFRERYSHLQALKRFTRETKDVIDLKQLSSSLVTTVANGMQSCAVYLLLPSPKTGNFVTHSYYGQKSTVRLSFSASSLLTLTMKYHDSPIDSNDIDGIPSLNTLADGERQALARNQIELLLPLKTKDRLVGMLLLRNKFSGEPYSTEDRRLLQTISNEVAVSIENASLYESMQKEHSELQKAMGGIIHAMSLVVETRDPYTAGHQRRVAELACAIAREMGLSEWHIKGLHITGLLHDVGKMVVPAEILSKPGRLNQHEFSIIKSHPKVGYEILEMIEFPWPVTQTILQHHERLDGSGYPDGLSGEDIILEARILGVADVVEAMSSHRPYRPALGLDSALKEISKERGVLYHSEVVDACLRLFQKKEVEFEQLMTTASHRYAYT